MYNMMDYSIGSGWVLAWVIHAAAVVLFSVGVLLLVAYAGKRMTDGQLKTWGIGLAVAGTILCLLTLAAWPAVGARSMYRNDGDAGMMGMMDERMDEMDEHMDEMMGDDHGDHSDMTMDDMMHSLDGLRGDAFDEAFIRAMIPHHQGAIDMAEAVLENAKHEELKTLARDIIEAQQREIDMMNGWLRDWGYEE